MSGWAAVGAAAGSILGKAFDVDSVRAQQNRQADIQKDFARHGLQWRVKDAEAAGLHPLYAIGANLPTYSPSSIVDPGVADMARGMGQDLSRAAKATMTPQQQVMQELQEQYIRAQIAERQSAAAANWSQVDARLNAQVGPGMASPADPDAFASGTFRGIGPGGKDLVQLKPDEVVSRSSGDPSTSAGKPPFGKLYEFRPGMNIWLPQASSAGEAIEAISESWPLTALMLAENERRQPGFTRKLIGPYLPDLGIGSSLADFSRAVQAGLQRWINSGKRTGPVDWREKYLPRR